MLKTINTPIPLPKGWKATSDSRGVVIDAYCEGRMMASVTVDEQARGFVLGVSGVRKSTEGCKYVGRGWRQQLYNDAVAALQALLIRWAAPKDEQS